MKWWRRWRRERRAKEMDVRIMRKAADETGYHTPKSGVTAQDATGKQCDACGRASFDGVVIDDEMYGIKVQCCADPTLCRLYAIRKGVYEGRIFV